MSVEVKRLVIGLLLVVFAVVFFWFTRFVKRRLRSEQIGAWRVVMAGGYITIGGMGVSTYFNEIGFGARMSATGIIIAFIGIVRFVINR